MEKGIKISFEGKSYKLNLTKELEQALFFHLQEKYIFDENGYLVRKGTDSKETNIINKQILEALLDVLSKYSLSEEYLTYLKNIKNSDIKVDDLIAYKFYKTSVDELVIIYNNEVIHKDKSISKTEEKVSQPIKEEPKIIATPKIPSNNELSKEITFSSEDATKNKELAHQVLLRASKDERFKSFVDEVKIKKAVNKIVICKDQIEFEKKYTELSRPQSTQEKEEIKKRLAGIMAYNNPIDGKTYINKNCRLEIIVHELNHFLSINGEVPGLEQITSELIPNDIQERLNIRYQGSTNEEVKTAYSEALNEAVTLYVTRKMLPELNVSDAYSYGATFLEKYIQSNESNEQNVEQELFNAYYNGNKKSLDYIINQVNSVETDYFFKILDSMLVDQSIHMQLIPLKYAKTLQTKEEIEKVLNKIRKKIELKMTSSGNIEEFHKIREEYSKKESEYIKQIKESKKNNEVVIPEVETSVKRG